METNAAPGWYQNPNDPAQDLYWDGTQWMANSARPHEGEAPATTIDQAPAWQAPVAAPKRTNSRWLTPFLIGAAVGIGVSIAGIVVINSRGGGVLWFGGYFITLAFWRTAWARRGNPSQSSMIIAGVIGALTIASAAWFGVSWLHEKSIENAVIPNAQPTVGSCWLDASGGYLDITSCSNKLAKYTGEKLVTNPDQCPANAPTYVEVTANKSYLCLAAK